MGFLLQIYWLRNQRLCLCAISPPSVILSFSYFLKLSSDLWDPCVGPMCMYNSHSNFEKRENWRRTRGRYINWFASSIFLVVQSRKYSASKFLEKLLWERSSIRNLGPERIICFRTFYCTIESIGMKKKNLQLGKSSQPNGKSINNQIVTNMNIYTLAL